jgi:tellurite resistance protein TehA-like permease
MVAIILHNLPYNGEWLYWISVVLFAFTVTIFSLFTFISALRYLCYPEIWWAMLRHPTEALFLGTFPMGFGIIAELVTFICVPAWGEWATILAWTLWWIEAVLSVAICFYLPFLT